MKSNKVALAPFLRSCTEITTLGIRPNLDDYSAEEKALLLSAERIFFPTPRFAYLFNALKIPTFPRYSTYRFRHSRVLQQILLAYMEMPHPATRIYFGNRQKARILETFRFPFLAMGPHAALHKKQQVDNPAAFEECCRSCNPLIIQKTVDWGECVRLLCVDSDCVGILWRGGPPASDNSYEPVPLDQPEFQSVLESTRSFIRNVQIDDIVIEWGYGEGKWQLIDVARPPIRWPVMNGILNRHHHICRLVQSGRL